MLEPTEIDATSVVAACRLAEWFLHETRRVYHLLREQPGERHRRELIELIRGRGGSISVRELMHSAKRYRPTAVAKVAIDGLVAAGVATWVDMPPTQPTGGRPPSPQVALTQ